MLRTICITVVLGALGATATAAPVEPSPCRSDPRYRQLDFLVGEWRVDVEREVLGKSQIEVSQEGCALEERWSKGDTTGQVLLYFDRAAEVWRRVSVDSRGSNSRSEGDVGDGEVHFRGEKVLPDGSRLLVRALIEELPDGRFRHREESSEDGGTSWSRDFEVTYVPTGRGASRAAAGTPSRPESPPRPTPPLPAREEPAAPPEGQSAEVRILSQEARQEELPPADREPIRMASPMVFEVEVGPVDQLPEGYAWSTSRTAQYRVEGASIRRVEVSHKRQKGKVALEVRTTFDSQRTRQRVDLLVELLSGGQLVASETLKALEIGSMFDTLGREEGLRSSVTFPLGRERFAQLFAEGERPSVRLTLTVR